MINDPGVTALEGVVGCGERLQRAREAAGMSLEEVAGRLHMPVQVVSALEAEQWERLGAPVFIRGQLKSYARLLQVDLDPLLEQARVASVEPTRLVSHAHTPRARRLAESFGRRALYVGITAVLAVPVWFASRGVFSDAPPNTASLDVFPVPGEVGPLPGSVGDDAQLPLAAQAVQGAAAVAAIEKPPVPTPYAASMTPVSRPAATGKGLTLTFSGDSWAEIFAPDGAVIERQMIKAGETRSYKAGEVGRMKLGNATDVAVQESGSAVDLAPYRSRANVAHFAVSSDGYVTPVSP